MKIKVFVLLVLGALASGTGTWAAKESASKASSCCGFCIPDEPCCGFCDWEKSASKKANAKSVQLNGNATE